MKKFYLASNFLFLMLYCSLSYAQTSTVLTPTGETNKYLRADNSYQTISSGSGTVSTGTARAIGKWTAADTTILPSTVIFDDGTNIGVGTSAPTAKLEISGTVKASGVNIFGTAVTGVSGTGNFILSSNSTASAITISGATTTPAVKGGTAVGSSLILQSTSGVGTTDFIKFCVGNACGLEAMRIKTNGLIGIGTSTPAFILDVVGTVQTSAKILSTATSDLGWSVVSGANTACNTTCTSACVVGEDTSVVGTLVGCTNATADVCLCAGPS